MAQGQQIFLDGFGAHFSIFHLVGMQPYLDSMMKPKAKTVPAPEPVEWDLSESFGVLPQELPLNHNLGCVRTPSSKKEMDKPQPADPSAKK